MRGFVLLPNSTSRSLRTASIVLFACGLLLAADIGGDLHLAVLYPASLSLAVWVHLGLELLAYAGLGWAFVLTRREMRVALAEGREDRNKLNMLRDEFDAFMHRRFSEWGLSAAERDIALLSVRGLRISEIAALRATRDGTIKSQLSAIFRKSGVATRTQFVALFLDEFLDLSARPAAVRDAPQGPD